MKKVEIEIPDGHRAEWVNGVLTLVRKNLSKFKFNIGDKVTINSSPFTVFIIEKQLYQNGEAYYELDRRYGYYPPYKESELTLYACGPKVEYKFKVGDKVFLKAANQVCAVEKVIDYLSAPAYEVSGWDGILMETAFEPVPQDITERIKTFIDAWAWCNENGKEALVDEYDAIIHSNVDSLSDDILAYLKLRIITAALNEGWEAKIDSDTYRYRVLWDAQSSKFRTGMWQLSEQLPPSLLFKSLKLSEYAAKQFRDIYADFFGIKKGGEK